MMSTRRVTALACASCVALPGSHRLLRGPPLAVEPPKLPLERELDDAPLTLFSFPKVLSSGVLPHAITTPREDNALTRERRRASRPMQQRWPKTLPSWQ